MRDQEDNKKTLTTTVVIFTPGVIGFIIFMISLFASSEMLFQISMLFMGIFGMLFFLVPIIYAIKKEVKKPK